jgi:SAM-dependent methyltransferase
MTGDSAPNWSEELTDFHESHAGSDHFIDVASRRHALEMLVTHGSKAGTVLDAGCSSGFLIRELRERFPSLVVMGSDVVKAPLERLRATLPDVTLLVFDLVRCPLPSDSLDAVILLNVLEHIQDDGAALRQVQRILKPGGIAIIEVPAGPGLFDVYDELLMHYRRYRLSDLTALVSNAGFDIVDRSHLGFFLFPPFFISKKLSRLVRRFRKTDPRQSVSRKIQSTRRNVLARALMNLELALGRWISYPFGIRCLVTARKPAGEDTRRFISSQHVAHPHHGGTGVLTGASGEELTVGLPEHKRAQPVHRQLEVPQPDRVEAFE